jgi:hypothetical protein
MPTFAAVVLASVSVMAVAETLRGRLPTRASALIELVLWIGVFWAARAVLRRLRPTK